MKRCLNKDCNKIFYRDVALGHLNELIASLATRVFNSKMYPLQFIAPDVPPGNQSTRNPPQNPPPNPPPNPRRDRRQIAPGNQPPRNPPQNQFRNPPRNQRQNQSTQPPTNTVEPEERLAHDQIQVVREEAHQHCQTKF